MRSIMSLSGKMNISQLRKRIIAVISMACLLGFTFSGNAVSAADSASQQPVFDPAATAGQLVELLIKADYEKVAESFDSNVKAQMSADGLKQAWEALQQQTGPFVKQAAVNARKSGNYDTATVTCKFEKSYLDIVFAFNSDGTIAGLSFQPSAFKELPATLTEKEVVVGTGEWKLPGTLTLPAGKGPFRAVVLVHGSGANDRDETIGPNKPFRDLAWGLASKGIAVLRYDKRTLVYGSKIAQNPAEITVKQETVDDAMEAVKLLRNTPGIDKTKIIVLGHSLGGMLIPRIGAADGKIAGLISMAGPARPLEDLIVEQTRYLLSIDTTLTAEQKKQQLDQVLAEVKKVKSAELAKQPATAMILWAGPKYWLDLRGYNPPAAAKKLKQPLLVLQGGRDYQVTASDFQLWKKGLAAKKNICFKLYSDLNHLFMTGKGKSIPQEYMAQGSVSEAVIKDISAWVKNIK